MEVSSFKIFVTVARMSNCFVKKEITECILQLQNSDLTIQPFVNRCNKLHNTAVYCLQLTAVSTDKV